jgi:hypothetical protein
MTGPAVSEGRVEMKKYYIWGLLGKSEKQKQLECHSSTKYYSNVHQFEIQIYTKLYT